MLYIVLTKSSLLVWSEYV